MNTTAFSQVVHFDRALIDRYNQSGPRYTSYPTAPHFRDDFGPDRFREVVQEANQEGLHRPLSLYLHIPFCDTVCYYCACNRTVTPDRSRAEVYLDYLIREIRQVGALFPTHRSVEQVHFGGGTPTYLDLAQLTRLWNALDESFHLKPENEGEYGIEIDPRELPPGTITGLRRLGFNRLSIGVQDLDERVQQAVNRVQPLSLTRNAVDEARQSGFVSINLDLIYGLPFQSVASFHRTLTTVIEQLRPDRLAVFNYAHLPQYFSPQRRINAQDLPSPDEKLRILEDSIQVLTAEGYVYIGMDHFALPGDELAVAQRSGVLHRNFQGYTTHGECDLVGLGTTAISQVGPSYAQNLKELEPYYQRLDQGKLTISKGIALTRDDQLRQTIIMRLLCDFRLDTSAIAKQFQIDFAATFREELGELDQMAQEGLLAVSGDVYLVNPAGRLLIRNICMVFDWYLRHAEQKKTFSRTI